MNGKIIGIQQVLSKNGAEEKFLIETQGKKKSKEKWIDSTELFKELVQKEKIEEMRQMFLKNWEEVKSIHNIQDGDKNEGQENQEDVDEEDDDDEGEEEEEEEKVKKIKVSVRKQLKKLPKNAYFQKKEANEIILPLTADTHIKIIDDNTKMPLEIIANKSLSYNSF